MYIVHVVIRFLPWLEKKKKKEPMLNGRPNPHLVIRDLASNIMFKRYGMINFVCRDDPCASLCTCRGLMIFEHDRSKLLVTILLFADTLQLFSSRCCPDSFCTFFSFEDRNNMCTVSRSRLMTMCMYRTIKYQSVRDDNNYKLVMT